MKNVDGVSIGYWRLQSLFDSGKTLGEMGGYEPPYYPHFHELLALSTLLPYYPPTPLHPHKTRHISEIHMNTHKYTDNLQVGMMLQHRFMRNRIGIITEITHTQIAHMLQTTVKVREFGLFAKSQATHTWHRQQTLYANWMPMSSPKHTEPPE